jgi:hypothetical protein
MFMPLPNLFPRIGDQIQPPSLRPCGGGWICLLSKRRLPGDNTILLTERLQGKSEAQPNGGLDHLGWKPVAAIGDGAHRQLIPQ